MSKPGISIQIKKDEYKAIQSEEEASLLPKATDTNSKQKKKGKKKRKKRKAVSFWKLIMNWNFLFFAVNCVTPLGLLAWWYVLRPNTTIPYIISGILGLLISVKGFKHFKSIIALTQQANKFTKNNDKMRNEHRGIRKDVSHIKRANKDLRGTELRLRSANKKNKENLTNFREVQTFMKQLNIQDFEEVTKKATNLGKNWHDELLSQERDMLHLIFDRYEMNHDNKQGMTEDEFNKFAACLPDQYQKRFARLGTFEKFSNHKGLLEYADFEMVLDVFAEMVVDNIDIELEINKTPAATLNMIPMDISEQDSMMSDSASDSDGTDESDNNTGGIGAGFLDKLSIWRKGRKQDRVRQSANISRQLIFKSKTPTENASSYAFDIFDPTENENKTAEETKEPIFMKPKAPKRTVSAINAMHDVDASLDDDEINAYMQQTEMNDPSSPVLNIIDE